MIYWWMTYSTANGISHAASHKIKISFLKNCSKYILWSQISVSQGHTDIAAGNSGYSLYTSGLGQVQAVASTEQGKHKFNTVHFLYNYSISAVLNTNWLYNVYLSLPHLLASVFGHLNGVCCSFDVCSLCQRIW